MLEGEGSVQSGGSGSEDGVKPSSGSDGSSTGSVGLATGGGAASLASGDGGSAPAVPGDAALDPAAQAPALTQAQSEFLFGGRKWQSQKQAEDAFRSMFGRVPETQRKAAEMEKVLAERDAELQALRSVVSRPPQPVAQQGQGAVRGQTPDASAPFAERLARSGDLDFLASLLETKEGEDPVTGVKRFTAGLAQTISQEVQAQVDSFREQHIEPMQRQQQFSQHMGHAMGTIRQMSSEFSELDESNQSPEAQEHQQAFVETLKQFPPDFVRENPQLYMLASALITRYQHGTPVFSQAPGTSGSPSALSVMASEQALGAASSNPISGTSTPRPRANGVVETAEDRIRRENAEVPGRFRSVGGIDLGFGPA